MTRKLITLLAGAAVALAALPASAEPTVHLRSTSPLTVRTYDNFSAPSMYSLFGGMQHGPSYVTRSPDRTLTVVPDVKRYPLKLSFACVVSGTPVEFPNDIRISNPYDFATGAVQVAYLAPGNHSGLVNLPALAPGEGVFVSNAVPGGMTAGAPCEAVQK
ncbi:hypothetical protein P1J78_24965 [Psychromarinibacter sp. C21-152]|uniref:Uncharacterized protein n=1 Tax=Psychromarinibacter sediminicola TaxID=3033385 RepID=A0AAE3NTB0_9RHOB|nr:hypothetical protein [Psychromarinibacter sediminicola]MDF0603963.1 hypothetical protein [Psychromarinibacter sediminicola]